MLPLPSVRYPTFSFVSEKHCLHTLFVETESVRWRARGGVSSSWLGVTSSK
jgi:hypothetical protein